MSKENYKSSFDSRELWDNSDLFALNNNDGTYYIEKSRFSEARVTIDKEEFKEILVLSKYPLILNRRYADMFYK